MKQLCITYPYFVLQLDVNCIKAEPEMACEKYQGYCHSENEQIGRNEEQDPLFISQPVIKTENEVSFIYVYCYTSFTNIHICLVAGVCPCETSFSIIGFERKFVNVSDK
jgi:hypothetical protein